MPKVILRAERHTRDQTLLTPNLFPLELAGMAASAGLSQRALSGVSRPHCGAGRCDKGNVVASAGPRRGREEERLVLGEKAESGVVAAAAWSENATLAASEIARQLAPYDLSGLMVFVSPDYDVPTFASEIARRFGVTPVVGCTTAGEITPEGWSEGAVVAIGFLRRHFAFLARPIVDLSNFHVEAGRELTKQLRADLARFGRVSRRGAVRDPARRRHVPARGGGRLGAAGGARRHSDHRRLGRRRPQVRADLRHSRRRA